MLDCYVSQNFRNKMFTGKWHYGEWDLAEGGLDQAECGWDLAECGWDLAEFEWDLAESGRDLAELLERLTANASVATVMDSIQAPSDTEAVLNIVHKKS